jgi:hypothetical protein
MGLMLRRQIHAAAESLVPQPRAFEVEMATEKLKIHINTKELIKFQKK